jgi:phosphoribosylformimino-5-aminoimidazole carboxamide ribotide isomerase
MQLIPAIDLKQGQCVRLRQGRMEDNTVFSDDPVATARKWVDAGTKRLHLVDLDGAFAGKPKNAEVVHAICKAFPDLTVQIGGGIRTAETIQTYLDAGVNYVIIGTKAIEDPDFVAEMCAQFPGHIIVGLDAKDGMVATDGWAEVSGKNVTAVAQQFESVGVNEIIYTDISRDGMMEGVNLMATRDLARAISIPVIASGGMSSYDDIKALCHYESEGVTGVILGRAIYEGAIDLAEGQALADRLNPPI